MLIQWGIRSKLALSFKRASERERKNKIPNYRTWLLPGVKQVQLELSNKRPLVAAITKFAIAEVLEAALEEAVSKLELIAADLKESE